MVYLFRRFVAYYIDGFFVLLAALIGYIVYLSILGVPLAVMENPSIWVLFKSQLIATIVYFIIFEFLFNRTIGKMIMKFRINGLRTSKGMEKFIQVLGRTLMRLIPLDPFSIFFNEERIMWHDRVSKTKVVDTRSR